MDWNDKFGAVLLQGIVVFSGDVCSFLIVK